MIIIRFNRNNNVSPRTLSFTSKRATEVAVKKKHNIIHSYTIQSISSTARSLVQ